ncbi:MAG: DUF1292 domain-containing protein [Oscillospiraceae bacterium]|jgi:uncharacterized protein YrzB (UPF0473 family)|nr:DUF1292 domain-containing protein [Oscillospiraceae bacterium]MBQ4239538.1 DUF1292 domain-containing protein [Oscillospiraceae bacterium]MBQ5412165.1 DUF1292 domain-containing protein [Oscillospiraceae bacterium]
MADDRENDVITLEFEDGGAVECTVLGVFEVKGTEYVAFFDEKGQEIYFYRYLQSDEDHYDIADIETDEEFNEVSAAFDEITAEEE